MARKGGWTKVIGEERRSREVWEMGVWENGQRREVKQARKRDKVVESIPMYNEGSEVEIFMEALEAELRRADVEKREWKSILLSKLPPKTRHLVIAVAESHDSSYLDVKTSLLHSAGQTMMKQPLSYWGRDRSPVSLTRVSEFLVSASTESVNRLLH